MPYIFRQMRGGAPNPIFTPVLPTLLITTVSPLPSAVFGTAYSTTLSATGGNPPYVWSLASGTLVSGLSLNSSTGVISGTPGGPETDTLGILVTDSLGNTALGSFTLVISSGAGSPSITTNSPLTGATQGTPYTATLAATGGQPPYAWYLVSASGSNSWAVSSGGVLTGTPGAAEVDSLVIKVSDSASAAAQKAFSLTVAAPTGAYDYYISTTGSDSNPGTLASPWSITAINSKWSTYAGKKVGILPGTYNVYALCQAGSFNQPALSINGGTSGSPTLIQSTTPRAAILTAANPSGGAYPTAECGIIGQGQYYKAPPNLGNVIVDGLYLTRSYQYGFAFYLAGTTEGAGATGLEVRNCEVFDIGGNDNDNVGAIFMQYYTGAWIHNNKFHSVQPATNGQNPDDVAGIFSYYCRSNVYEYNTIYDCNNGIFDKYYPNGNHTWRYNYIESAGLYPQNAVHGASGGKMAGDTLTVHNNVMLCPNANGWDGSLSNTLSSQNLVFYNNTFVFGPGGQGIYYPAAGTSTSPGAMVTNYNNVYHLSSGSLGYQGILGLVANSILQSDYNLYGVVAANGKYLTLAPTSNIGTPSSSYTLSQAQSALGFDTHSVALDPTFVKPTLSATSLNPAGYALVAGTAGSATSSSPGRVGGVSSGAACDMGAWGGASPPTRIGCNFASVAPLPPALLQVT